MGANLCSGTAAAMIAVMAAVLPAPMTAKPVPFPVLEQSQPVDLPELLKTSGGRAVTTVDEWEKTRRPEILDFFTRNMHGERPVDRPDGLVFSRISPDRRMPGLNAVRRQVRISFRGPRGGWSFDVLAFLPVTGLPAPVFVLFCNAHLEKCVDPDLKVRSEFFPVPEITDRGYAVAVFRNSSIARDSYPPRLVDGKVVHSDPPFTNDVFACFSPERGEHSWGVISAWAWGASRVMDWIETQSDLDAAHVAVIGHSRSGKTALWTGATDRRFALVCANNSGCCGAKLNHVSVCLSETIALDNLYNPHWFCRAFRKFNGLDMSVPFDQHWLAALTAPRLLYIASASEDYGAGPWGEFLTARHASPAWELYRVAGLVEDGPYLPDRPFHFGRIGYHLRTGKHDLNLYDWNRYMDFADRHGFRGSP